MGCTVGPIQDGRASGFPARFLSRAPILSGFFSCFFQVFQKPSNQLYFRFLNIFKRALKKTSVACNGHRNSPVALIIDPMWKMVVTSFALARYQFRSAQEINFEVPRNLLRFLFEIRRSHLEIVIAVCAYRSTVPVVRWHRLRYRLPCT